ncbi:MAG: type IV secretory system conjugative DNA transfer family protein [Rhodoglobus sp.]
MNQPNNRRRDPGGFSTETLLLLIGITLVLTVLGVVNVAQHLGHTIDGGGGVSADPFRVLFQTVSGDLAWPAASTWVSVALVAVILALGSLGFIAYIRYRKRHTRVDRAATYMGRSRDIEGLSKENAARQAERLGVRGSMGVPIGTTLGNAPLFGTWEDMHIDIWGPRTGKTTSRAVPAILDAPGGVLVTSNKRDVVDATRDIRAAVGPVWVFDPQAIVLEPPTWWWNPLSYVTDEVKAARLADHFASGSRDSEAKTDAYFDPAGQDLLAGLLLAAALDQRPITEVYSWLTRPTEEEPVDILREHGFTLTADQVRGVINAPDKQRGGVYGTAQQMASCLTNRQVAHWVNPIGGNPDDRRPHFDPATFVRDGGTLYSLSKEGRGTAGPLVTALTVAVVEAAEELAAASAGGRLTVPLLGVLDEAANVCRWRELPNLYSHYGSRGIILMTILQSWSQGVDVWGESGMRKLWSASNIKVYGGGVAEDAFLEQLSKLIGDFDRRSSSVSSGRGGRSVNHQLHRERILGVDDLAALPKGRAVVLSSGNRPTLIRTQPWMTGPHAKHVKESIAAHDPQAARTIVEAEEAAAIADDVENGE